MAQQKAPKSNMARIFPFPSLQQQPKKKTQMQKIQTHKAKKCT
jgi:hypothetical protein